MIVNIRQDVAGAKDKVICTSLRTALNYLIHRECLSHRAVVEMQ